MCVIGCRYNHHVVRGNTGDLSLCAFTHFTWNHDVASPHPKLNREKQQRCNCVHCNLSAYYAKEQNALKSTADSGATVFRLNYLLISFWLGRGLQDASDTAGHFRIMRSSWPREWRRVGRFAFIKLISFLTNCSLQRHEVIKSTRV